MSSQSNALPLFGFDRLTLGLYLALVAVGWLMIFAVTYNPEAPYAFFDMGHTAGKQLGFIVFCLIMMFVIMMADWSFWRTLALPFYLISILLLPGTLLFGREVNGANAWYHIGGFTFQPSEIAEFGTCFWPWPPFSAVRVSIYNGAIVSSLLAFFCSLPWWFCCKAIPVQALVFFSLCWCCTARDCRPYCMRSALAQRRWLYWVGNLTSPPIR